MNRKSDHYEIWHAESKTNPQKYSVLKNKKIKSKMAADGIIFYVPRDCGLVKPVDRFGRVIRQNACFVAQGRALQCSEIYIFQFSPLKSQKKLGHFQCISYGKQKC